MTAQCISSAEMVANGIKCEEIFVHPLQSVATIIWEFMLQAMIDGQLLGVKGHRQVSALLLIYS